MTLAPRALVALARTGVCSRDVPLAPRAPAGLARTGVRSRAPERGGGAGRALTALALFAAGCGEVPPDPCALAVVTVAAPALRLQAWVAADDPSAVRDVAISPAECGLEVAADAAWLDARLEGGRLSISGDPSATGPGLHTARVTFTSSGTVRGTVPVTLSVLARAPEDGARRALVVGIDGCRPDAIVAADAPTLDALTALGRSTYTASTQLETATVSGPGWASILTGVEAGDHLVAGNDDLADVDLDRFPTFLWHAAGAGRSVLVAPQWLGLLTLLEPELEATAHVGNVERITVEAEAILATDTDLLFVHLDDVDHEGHTSGFSPTNPAYLAAIEEVDARVARMVDAILARPSLAEERWMIALTTDHGGSGTSHGALDAENRTVFLVLTDLGGEPAALPAAGVSHMDVGPSVLTHLGVAIDPTWALDGVAR